LTRVPHDEYHSFTSVDRGSAIAAKLGVQEAPRGGSVLDDTVDASTVTRELGECPVKCFTVFDDQDAGRYSDEAATPREETPAFVHAHAQGSWVATPYDANKHVYHNVDLAAADRDPRHDEDADVFRLDRNGTHHFGFAGGLRRCVGAHLARREVPIAVEEWHASVPHDRIATDEPPQERGGQLALLSLPLAWDAPPHDQNGGTTT
jgi:hypothetical protein